MKLVLTGTARHTFDYVDDAGEVQRVTVTLGQSVSGLGLSDVVLDELRKLHWTAVPTPRNMYYTDVDEAEADGDPVVVPVIETLPELDPNDPGAELARELRAADEAAERAARQAVADAKAAKEAKEAAERAAEVEARKVAVEEEAKAKDEAAATEAAKVAKREAAKAKKVAEASKKAADGDSK